MLRGQEEHGGSRPGWRFLAATRRDLEKEVRAGRFREDLYYRLSGVCLRLPPLRHRKEDIPALASLFLELYADRLGNPKPELSPRALSILLEYSWPGNIRELETAMKKVVALGDEEAVMSDLAAQVALTRLENGADGSISLKQAARAASRHAEKELILRVLARTQWNRKRAARELQISYKALLYKLKQIRQDGASELSDTD
jgi:two-component system response regulator AtoC